MSPALFTIVFDMLSRLLADAEEAGQIHGIKISRESPPISHLMYTDDLVIFCGADVTETMEILQCLNRFCKWS